VTPPAFWVTEEAAAKTADFLKPGQPASAEVGVVVISGVAADVGGASGATVSVMVSPVVTSDVVTGPGGGGSAALLSFEVTPSAPMTTTAPPPRIADASLICFEFTFDHSVRSLVRTVPKRSAVDPPLFD